MAVVPSPSMKQSLNRFYQRWRSKPALSFEASQAPPGTVACTLALPVVQTTHGRIEAHVVKSEAPNRKAADAAACKEAWVWLQARAQAQAHAPRHVAMCFGALERLPADDIRTGSWLLAL